MRRDSFAAAWARGTALTAYNPGIHRNTSADIRRRAAAEVAARLEGAGGDAHGVVFCFGEIRTGCRTAPRASFAADHP